MDRVFISNIEKYNKKNIKINGWVYNTRRSGKIGFLMLRDGSGIIQCIVFRPDIGEDEFNKFKKLSQESSISVEGKVINNKKAIGGFEIQVSGIIIHHKSDGYPISPKEHGTDFLMNNRHLWLRSKRQNAME